MPYGEKTESTDVNAYAPCVSLYDCAVSEEGGQDTFKVVAVKGAVDDWAAYIENDYPRS